MRQNIAYIAPQEKKIQLCTGRLWQSHELRTERRGACHHVMSEHTAWGARAWRDSYRIKPMPAQLHTSVFHRHITTTAHGTTQNPTATFQRQCFARVTERCSAPTTITLNLSPTPAGARTPHTEPPTNTATQDNPIYTCTKPRITTTPAKRYSNPQTPEALIRYRTNTATTTTSVATGKVDISGDRRSGHKSGHHVGGGNGHDGHACRPLQGLHASLNTPHAAGDEGGRRHSCGGQTSGRHHSRSASRYNTGPHQPSGRLAREGLPPVWFSRARPRTS